MVVSNDPRYEIFSNHFNIRIQREPKGFLVPMNEEDVKLIIRCAKQLNLKVVTKSGGHSHEKYSYGTSRHWVIDMAKMKSISIDHKTLTAKVGAGVTMEQLANEVTSRGFLLPFGICFTVGVSGFTFGGGDGISGRHTGLMIQRLRSVNIVTSESTLLTVNETNEPDLFFALRGAGAQSFGVVTQFTFHLLPLPSTIIINKVYPNGYISKLLRSWIRFAESNQPNSVTSDIYVNWPKPGEVQLIIVIIRGDPKEEMKVISELKRRFPDVEKEDIRYQSYIATYRNVGYYIPKVYFKGHNYFFSTAFSKSEMNSFVSAAKTLFKKCQFCSFYMSLYGGKMRENDNNAFVHTTALYNVLTSLIVPVGNNDENIVRKVGNSLLPHMDEFVSNIRELDSGYSYQNYVDSNRTDWRTRFFHNIYPLLTNIKRQYDPSNFFSCPQCVEI